MANLGNVKIDSFSPTSDPNVKTINVTKESRVDKYGNIHSPHGGGDIFIKINENGYTFIANSDGTKPPYPICVYQTVAKQDPVCTNATEMPNGWSYSPVNDKMIKLSLPDIGAGNRFEYKLFIHGPGGDFAVDPIIGCCYRESIFQILAEKFNTSVETVAFSLIAIAYIAGITTMKLLGGLKRK